MSDRRVRMLEGDAAAAAPIEAALARTVRVFPSQADPQWRHQLILIALTDILGRLLPSLRVEVDPGVVAHGGLPAGPQALSEQIQIARSHGIAEGDGGEPAVTVAVGPTAEAADLYIDGSGWVSYLGSRVPEPFDEDETNPIGPLAAACRGAARVVALLLAELSNAEPPPESCYWNALTYDGGPDRPNENPPLKAARVQALLMGGGSIGGAATYAFARVPGLTGELIILDPQALEDRNLDKALLARPPEVAAGAMKAMVAEAELAGQQLSVDARPVTLADYVAANPRVAVLPLVLCAVDSTAARRELQDSLPLEVINAACGSKDVTVSGHRTDDGPCVYCLYLETVLDRSQAMVRILHRETGMPEPQIGELVAQQSPLNILHVRGIERHRGLSSGALAQYEGSTLERLFRERFLYGEEQVEVGDGHVAALASPHVTALAGILLAAEALKAGAAGTLDQYRLGPWASRGTKYEEHLSQAPGLMVTSPPRWPDAQCLCNSSRRLQLLHQRYGAGAGT